MQAISHLKTMTAPFLPFSAAKLREMLGLEGSVEDTGWAVDSVESGQPFPRPTALFTKLDEAVAEEEMKHMLSDSGRS